MERTLRLVEPMPTDETRWPSIASASHELLLPRRIRAASPRPAELELHPRDRSPYPAVERKPLTTD